MAFIQLDFKSKSLMRGVNVKVLLPSDEMTEQWTAPYRTLYLLPGYSASSTELLTYLSLRKQCELKGIAIVIPDGENLFYQDMPERMIFYSEYVGRELVEVTRKLLPLSERREDTFIGGISMGGYGALYNGMKYQKTFSKIAAFSPAVDAYKLLVEGKAPGFSKEQFQGIFGGKEEYYQSDRNLGKLWTSNADEYRPELFLCCGIEDRAVYEVVRQFEEELNKAGVVHCYREGNGDHELEYWEKMLEPAFSFLAGIEEGTKDKLVIKGDVSS